MGKVAEWRGRVRRSTIGANSSAVKDRSNSIACNSDAVYADDAVLGTSNNSDIQMADVAAG
jgi:hypothetical protein